MQKLVPLVGVLLLLLAACGGSTATTQAPGSSRAPAATTGSATTAPNPPAAATGFCELLTVQDVSRIAGKPAVLADDQTGDNCTINVGAGEAGIPDYVINFRKESGDLSGPHAAFPGGQDLSGLGESAYWSPDAEALWFTRAGQTYTLQLVLFGDDDGDELAIAQQLVQAALARL